MSSSTSSSSTPTNYATVAVDASVGVTLTLDAMKAEEELGRPFLITVDASSDTAKADLTAGLGTSVTVTLTTEAGTTRYFNGILAKITYTGLAAGAYRYRLELRPWIWTLSQAQNCVIYQNQSAWTIITGIFSAAGFSSNYTDSRSQQSGSIVLTYCVQYRESTFDFVSRLMEQYGIYYFTTHANGSHTLVFADDPSCHSAASSSAIPFAYTQAEDWQSVDDHIWDWAGEATVLPGKVTLADYNFTVGNAAMISASTLAGSHTYGTSEIYDYPGIYAAASDGSTIAGVRMQERNALRQTYSATSNSRLLLTGTTFTLSGFSETALNTSYLIISTSCSISLAEALSTSDGALIDTFRVLLKAIPATTTFRLPCITPRPTINGPQTAIVADGNGGIDPSKGTEINTDQYGRISVKFPWDRTSSTDSTTPSSCWVRVAQGWAGTAWGSIFIPRVGQEVVVEYEEGNPDRPIITGSVYNTTQTVPYTLPGNATRSTIMTRSSTGGSAATYNELRFEDKTGSEEIYLQAQKDWNTTVKNNHTATIAQNSSITISQGNLLTLVQTGDHNTTISQGNLVMAVNTGNETHTISQGNRSVTVSQGNDTHTVSTGNRSATISQGNDSITVSTGNHSITVSAGSCSISAGQSITLSVGSNSIKIDTTGITLSAAQIQLSATGQLQASGATVSLTGQASLSIDGGASTAIKGGMVMIN